MGRLAWLDFVEYIYQDNNIYVVSSLVIATLLFYCVFLKKEYKSIFDPFFINCIIMNGFATSVCIVMYFADMFYDETMFVVFLISELALLWGYRTYQDHEIEYKVHDNGNDDCIINLLVVYEMIYITITFASFIFIGVPLLSDGNRLEFYKNGTGIFSVILNSILPTVIFLLLYVKMIIRKKQSLFLSAVYKITWLLLIANILGTGAKGSGLILVFDLYLFMFFTRKFYSENKVADHIKKYLFIGSFIAIIVAIIALIHEGGASDLESTILGLLIRMIGNGDIYAYFFSSNYHNAFILNDNIMESLLGPLLQVIRLYDYDHDLAPVIGLQIWQLANNSSEIKGPNTRGFILYFVYLGSIGAVVFSYFTGVITSFIRNKLYLFLQKKEILFPFYMIIYNGMMSFSIDPAMSVLQIGSGVVINGTIIGFVLFTKICKWSIK